MRLRAILFVAACALAAPASAWAVPVLEEGDATELANQLAEATEAQGICYGWRINVSDPTGVEEGVEAGSNQGPGEPVVTGGPGCERYVELTGGISYVSEYSDSEDSAGWTVESNLPNPPTAQDLADLGYEAGDLLGEDNDLAILNAAGALPALVADRGAAKPVPFETERRAAGVGGEPTGQQGSDFLRENGTLLALCALLLVIGVLWFLKIRHDDRKWAGRRTPSATSTTST